MKQFHLAATMIFSLATPLLIQAISPTMAVAQANSPNGVFADREWTVTVYYENNSYHYRGFNRLTNSSIELSGATSSSDRQRKYYIWNNGGTRYRVSWNRQDPDFIRIQVKTPNGKEVLNRLLARSGEGGM